jgi:hypothetical protein
MSQPGIEPRPLRLCGNGEHSSKELFEQRIKKIAIRKIYICAHDSKKYHVVRSVVRSRLFKLPQACKTLIVSLVFCSPLQYQNVLYYYKCAVCSLQYRKENKVFYRFIVYR